MTGMTEVYNSLIGYTAVKPLYFVDTIGISTWMPSIYTSTRIIPDGQRKHKEAWQLTDSKYLHRRRARLQLTSIVKGRYAYGPVICRHRAKDAPQYCLGYAGHDKQTETRAYAPSLLYHLVHQHDDDACTDQLPNYDIDGVRGLVRC